jgi:hypothetical protein
MPKLNVLIVKRRKTNEPSKQKAPTCKFNKCLYDASCIHVYSIVTPSLIEKEQDMG